MYSMNVVKDLQEMLTYRKTVEHIQMINIIYVIYVVKDLVKVVTYRDTLI
jgi:hypothetical protein